MLGIFDYETLKEEERQRPVSSPVTTSSTSPTATKVKTSFTSLQHSTNSLLPKTDTTSTTVTTSSPFTSCSNNGAQQRKRKPLKSISNKDETPGFTFKISGTSTSSLNFEFSPSTFTHSMHSLFLEDGFNSSYSSSSTATRRRRLSSSCFNIIQTSNHSSGSQTPKNTAAATPTHTPPSNHTPKPRQRAQSLSFSVNTTTTTASSKRASQGSRRSSVSITSILQSCRSIENGSSESFSPNSTPSSSQEIGNGHGNGSGGGHGSLTHLIPNSFLQTTSRRTSTHTSVTECFCSSCSSTITPYWRDGWSSNVMLCNACGLRYQKFATRCPECRYIPRKEDGLGGNCIKCHTPWHVGPEDSSIRGTGYNPSGLLI